MTLQVSLLPADEDWIRNQVEGGVYTDVSDCIRALIHNQRTQADAAERWLEDLDQTMAESAADEAEGRTEDADILFERLSRRVGLGRAGRV